MAKTMKAIIALGGKVDPSLIKSMATAEKRMAAMKRVAGAVAIAVGTAAIKGVKDSIDAAATYEKQFAKTATLLKKGTDLSAYSEEILKLSDSTGIAAGDLTESVYQALSASVDQADAIEFAGQAARLASGGFTESASAVKIMARALNAYGKESGLTAEKVSDLLITTQNLGMTSVDELAQYLGKAIPIAKSSGVSMEQLSASMAILTANSLDTATASTYMRQMMTELGKDGSKVSKILEKETGQSFLELQNSGKTVYDVLDIINKSVDGDIVAFQNLWSKSSSQTAALTLLNAGSQKYVETLQAMEESSGATADAAGIMGDTYSKQMKKLDNLFENLKIRVGEHILPYLTQALEDNMPAITEVMQNLGNGIGGLFDGLGAVGDVFAPIGAGIADASAALAEHGPAMQDIADKLGPAFESFGQAAGDAIRGIGEALGPVIEGLSQLLDFLGQAYSGMSPSDVMMQDPTYNATGPSADPGNYGAVAGAMQDYSVNVVYNPDMSGITAMESGLQSVSASADAAAATSEASMGSAFAAGSAATQQFAASASSAASSAQSEISSACSSMESTVNGMHMQIPTITVASLPHFSMSGTFDPKTGAVPSVNVSYYARGGFTNGPIAIAGEAGTEAVISFDPRFRNENIGYWMAAGQMLGVIRQFAEGGFTGGLASRLSTGFVSGEDALSIAAGEMSSGGTSGSSVNLGGVTFAPQIAVSGTSEQDIMSQIRAARDEFEDWLVDLVGEMEDDYAYSF